MKLKSFGDKGINIKSLGVEIEFGLIDKSNQNQFDLRLDLIQGDFWFNYRIRFDLKLGLGSITFK